MPAFRQALRAKFTERTKVVQNLMTWAFGVLAKPQNFLHGSIARWAIIQETQIQDISSKNTSGRDFTEGHLFH